MRAEPAVLSWSGGKDSALALHVLREQGADAGVHVRALVTTVTEGYERISMHGVRTDLLRAQAAAIGLPLLEARIPPAASNARYEQVMHDTLAPLRVGGISRVVFGDLFLEEVRAYRERLLESLGMTAVLPLWGRDTAQLAREFIDRGFRAMLVCVDPRQLPPELCGREFDDALLTALPGGADPCGERGEFHTFVYDGPIFRRPVSIRRGEVVERDGFWFADLTAGDPGGVQPPTDRASPTEERV